MLIYCFIPSSEQNAKKVLKALCKQTYPCKIYLCTEENWSLPDIENLTIHHSTNLFEVIKDEDPDTWIMWGRDEIPTSETLHTFMRETDTYTDSILGHAGWRYIGFDWVYVNYHAHEVNRLDGICMTKCKNLKGNSIRLDVIETQVENHYPTIPIGKDKKYPGLSPTSYKTMSAIIVLFILGLVYYPKYVIIPYILLSMYIFKWYRQFAMKSFNLAWWIVWFAVFLTIIVNTRRTYEIPLHVLWGCPLALINMFVANNKKYWYHLATRSLLQLEYGTYIPKFSQPVIYVANYPSDFIEHSIVNYLGDSITIISSGKMNIATCFMDMDSIIYVPTEDKKLDNYKRTLRIIKAQFEKNRSVFAYPEHHYWDRSSFYNLCRFRTGLFRIAKELNVPIVPVVLSHFNTLFGIGSNTLKLKVHEPIQIEDVEKDTKRCFNLMSRTLNRFKYSDL